MNIFKRVVTDNPFEEQVKKELSTAYLSMIQSSAWKDLENKMTQMIEDSNRDVDNKPIHDMTVADVARARGVREAITKIRVHVNFYLNGK